MITNHPNRMSKYQVVMERVTEQMITAGLPCFAFWIIELGENFGSGEDLEWGGGHSHATECKWAVSCNLDMEP